MSRVDGAFTALVADTTLGGTKLPMRLASKMHTLANNPAALRAFLADHSAAGNWASLPFIDS